MTYRCKECRSARVWREACYYPNEDRTDEDTGSAYCNDCDGPTEIIDDTPPQFKNYYECDACAIDWSDSWSCQCDDRCPRCGAETEPYKSEDAP